MTDKFHSLNGVVWTYITAGLGIGVGIILLPFQLAYLTQTELALWFIFNTLLAIPQIIETGYQSTIVRNFGYIHAGIQKLQKAGLTTNVSNEKKNIKLEAELLATAKLINSCLTYASILIITIFGAIYIYRISLKEGAAVNDIIISWCLISAGYIINVKFLYLNYILQGQGKVAAAQKAMAIPRAIQLILGAGCLVMGLGLIGLGLASVIANLCGRWVAWRYYEEYIQIEVRMGCKSNKERIKHLKTLSFNSIKLIAVTAGTFLIQKFNILIASTYLGLATTSTYALSVTIFGSVAGISSAIAQARNPELNYLQVISNKTELRKAFGEISIIAFTIYLVLVLFIFIVGLPLLKEFFPNVNLLDNIGMLILAIFFFFELSNGVAGSYIATTNKIPFLVPTLCSGIGISLFSIILIKTTTFGVLSLPISQLLVQSLYNNWKWLRDAVIHLGGGYFEILSLGVGRIKSHW